MQVLQSDAGPVVGYQSCSRMQLLQQQSNMVSLDHTGSVHKGGTIPTERRDDPHRGAQERRDDWHRGAQDSFQLEATQNDAKPRQNTSGLFTTHPAGTTDALGSRRTTFQTIWSTFMCTNPKGTPERERDPRTIEAPEPQPQDHARRNH